MYGYVSESVVCLQELAYEYMNPNLWENRGSWYMHCEDGLNVRISIEFKRMAHPAFVREKVLYPNN